MRVAAGAAVLAAAYLAWRLRHILALLFAAVLVALLLDAVARPLARRTGLKRVPAVLLVLVAGVAIVGASMTFFGWRLQAQVAQVLDLLPSAIQSAVARAQADPIGAHLIDDLNRFRLTAALSRLPSYALNTLDAVAQILLVLAAGAYLAGEPALYRRGALALFKTAPWRPRLDAALEHTGERLRKWLLAQLVAMATVGLMVAASLWLIGVPAPFALALFAGFAEFVPILGPVAAFVPAVLIALLAGVDKALWTAGAFILIQQIEGNLLIPLLQRSIISLPPVLTLFALLVFGALFGLTGVLLATPLTIVSLVLVRRLYLNETD